MQTKPTHAIGLLLAGAQALSCSSDRNGKSETNDTGIVADASPQQVVDAVAPGGGAAWELASLPVVRLSVVDPATGNNRQDFLLDDGPSCSLTHRETETGLSSRYDCRLTGGAWKDLHAVATVDYHDVAWGTDAQVSLVSLPTSTAVAALGLELRMADTPEREHVVYTTYSGGYQVDEPANAPGGPMPGRMDYSVQAIPYWADDGSAMLVWAADPTGEEPKDIVGRPIAGTPAQLALGWEAFAPNSQLGGHPFTVPFPIRITRFSGDWYDAAKLYRGWLESEATGVGQILELGRIEQRADVSQFAKELDLIGVNNTMWYQGKPADQQALRSLARLPSELGAQDILYMFWGTSNASAGDISYGLPGTWLPYPTLAADTQILLDAGVRSMIYTMPQLWSVTNPALAETGAWQHLSEDRHGVPLQDGDTVYSDTASSFWPQFFEQLASAHATTFSGAHAFYTDDPYFITEDFVRSSGPLGFTRGAYTGLCEINRAIRRGGQTGAGEFMTVHESATERLIRCTDMEVPGAPLTHAYNLFYTNPIPSAQFVPFFSAVYSGYTMLSTGDARFGANTLTSGLWTKDPKSKHFIEESFENMARAQAMNFALGGIATWSELEGYFEQGLLVPELTSKELGGHDPKASVAPFVAHLSALIAARARARRWLAFGEMLRDPAVGGDRAAMHLHAPYEPFGAESYDVPLVATGAFRAEDGSVRIAVANGSRSDAEVVLDLARIDAAGATVLADPAAGVSFDVHDGRATFTVTAGAAWVLQPGGASWPAVDQQ